ncbi:MAG: glycyl-radical enzyme activating protein [Anaerolineales bacterium]
MIFDIKRYAIHDGPGIRTAVFMKGCPLECWWCHNPEGQRAEAQLIFRSNRCKASKACLVACPQDAIIWQGKSITHWELCDDCGKCAEVCFAGAREIIGREVTVNQLMAEIERDIPFYEQSGGGVTFTGGEPVQQSEFLAEALIACKEKQIHTIVDTCGYSSWENYQAILPLVDLFLYDVKLMNSEKHIKYTSVPNKQILDNLKKLSGEGVDIIVRVPLIPGINDGEENLEMCGLFLKRLPKLMGIEFIPYHEIGVAKYQALGMTYKLEKIITPTEGEISKAENLFTSYDLPVIKHPSGRTV